MFFHDLFECLGAGAADMLVKAIMRPVSHDTVIIIILITYMLILNDQKIFLWVLRALYFFKVVLKFGDRVFIKISSHIRQ